MFVQKDEEKKKGTDYFTSAIPIKYGLPKIYKQYMLFRPVISGLHHSAYLLRNWISSNLSALPHKLKHTVCNSLEVKQLCALVSANKI